MQIFTRLWKVGAIAWLHRWKALSLAWLVCLLGWGGLALLPDRYQSSARVSADADAVMTVLLRGLTIDSSLGGQVDMLHRTLLNRRNLDRLVDETDLHRRVADDTERDRLIQTLAQDIRFTQPTKNLFSIEYRDVDPHVAHAVVEKTLTLFLDAVVESDRQQLDSAQQFLTEQIGLHEQRLREAGRQRFEFQSRFADLLPGPSAAPSRFETQRALLPKLRGELADARHRQEVLRGQIEAAPQLLVTGTEGGGVVGPAVGPGQALAEAERTVRELRLRYTEQHPDLIVARQLLATLRAGGTGGGQVVAPRNVSRPNPLYEQLKVRLVDAETQVAALERQVEEIAADQARLEQLTLENPDPAARFMALDRNYNVVRRNYEELLNRREALQIADAARSAPERAKIEVVDAPRIPAAPSSPKRALLTGVVLFAGVMAGAALAVALVQFDRAFYTVQDLRRFGLPVIGGVSAVAGPRFFSAGSIAGFGLACVLLLLAFGAVLTGPAALLRIMT